MISITCRLALCSLLAGACGESGASKQRAREPNDPSTTLAAQDASLAHDAAPHELPGLDAGVDAACAAPCAQDGERDLVISGGGRKAGFCQGECVLELEVDTEITLDVGQFATLRIKSAQGELLDSIRARLDEAAWNGMEVAASDLPGVTLEESYGSALPVDGADAWVSFTHFDFSVTQHSYPDGSPPAVLAKADALVRALIAQLRACQGELLMGECTHGTE